MSSTKVNGSCYNLNAFSGGRLVAGIGGTINIFRWRDAPMHAPAAEAAADAAAPKAAAVAASKELVWECGHSGHIIPLYVETRGDFIVCGDVMKSISLLMYDRIKGKISERARDHNANYMTAVSVLDDDVYLGAENSFNIFTVMKNADAASDEDRNRLDVVGEFHLGEFVNRFRRGSLGFLLCFLPSRLLLLLPLSLFLRLPRPLPGLHRPSLYLFPRGLPSPFCARPRRVAPTSHTCRGRLGRVVQGIYTNVELTPGQLLTRENCPVA